MRLLYPDFFTGKTKVRTGKKLLRYQLTGTQFCHNGKLFDFRPQYVAIPVILDEDVQRKYPQCC
jgi:hypothetical protein